MEKFQTPPEPPSTPPGFEIQEERSPEIAGVSLPRRYWKDAEGRLIDITTYGDDL